MSECGDLKPFLYDHDKKTLQVLDQKLLPNIMKYDPVVDCSDGFRVIKEMMVRGAPCIAAVGCLSLVVELNKISIDEQVTKDGLLVFLKEKSSYLIKSRPTAVNLSKALKQLVDHAEQKSAQVNDVNNLIKDVTIYCEDAINIGLNLNIRLGDFGADIIKKQSNKPVRVLTHCNTGSLATVGYGTALGVIRSLKKKGILEHVFCTETRPYNQGSRLTAFELVHDKIPATLIADSMVAYLMLTKGIDCVVVGADVVALNGDTANKIGTYQIALLCKQFSIPFYVAVPAQTINFSANDSSSFKIEDRPAREMKYVGNIQLAPDAINAWNPCFDVTPSHLITSYITEYGNFTSSELPKVKAIVDSATFQNKGLF